MDFDFHLLALVVLGFLAGLMDAAVGGGGLLQVPGLFAILPEHTPAVSILGINKSASSCGTLTATVQYAHKIRVPWRMLLPAAVLAFIASYSGAKLVSHLPVQYIKPMMLMIMVVMFIYTFCKKDLGQIERTTDLSSKETMLGLFFGALIGFYDGVFGPGTGSLLAFVFVRFFAYDFLTATASAKVINLTANLAALTFFIPHNHVVWAWAIPLAIANLSGGLCGAHLAMRGGSRFLRRGFMLLLCFIIGKFALDML